MWFRTGPPNSSPSSGRHCTPSSGPRSVFPPGTIPSPTGRLNALTRSWKPVSAVSSPRIRSNGASICYGLSTHTALYLVLPLVSPTSSVPTVICHPYFQPRDLRFRFRLQTPLCNDVAAYGPGPARFSFAPRPATKRQGTGIGYRPQSMNLVRGCGSPHRISSFEWSLVSWLRGSWAPSPFPRWSTL